MPFYRVLKPLSKGMHGQVIKRGSVVRLEWLDDKQQQRLMDVGAISRLKPPPLHVLPGWKTRAAKLHKQGVLDTETFLEMDSEDLAERLNVKVRTIERWKREIWDWLIVDQPELRG